MTGSMTAQWPAPSSTTYENVEVALSKKCWTERGMALPRWEAIFYTMKDISFNKTSGDSMHTPSPLPEARLVAHLFDQASQPPSPATRERLAQALLDWTTAGLAALDLPAAATMRGIAMEVSPGTGPSRVFGGAAAHPVGAAFANAAIAHLREIDDAHRAAMLRARPAAVRARRRAFRKRAGPGPVNRP
ncbi:MmgE/PrpD family protein [Paracidovorax citrulli]|uniref:MmgE/PrpD family protein n=1 Tax=Paracidovorax citrulli TaxID=80869 RepID=UPI003EC0437E